MKLKKEIKIDETNIDLETVVNNCVYSTSEIIIGKYIDNKPIYKKTFVFALTGTYVENDKTYTWVYTGVPIDTLINIYGNIPMANGYKYPVNIEGGANACVDQSNRIQVGIRTSIDTQQTVNITLEYTKTTD